MTEIGIFEAKYNKNSKVMYSQFIPSIATFSRNECEIENCEPTKIKELAQKTIAEWFKKIEDIELSDKFEHPIKFENIEEIHYQTGELKNLKIKVYQETGVL